MNSSRDNNIIIREKLFARAAADRYKKSNFNDDFVRGMYCTSAINCRTYGCVLCVFLDNNGSFKNEVMLNRDYAKLHEHIYSKVISYADKFASNKLFIGRMISSDDDTEYIVAGSILIFDALQKHGIELIGYYITNGTSYENILPER